MEGVLGASEGVRRSVAAACSTRRGVAPRWADRI